jgi:hypothetical protein
VRTDQLSSVTIDPREIVITAVVSHLVLAQVVTEPLISGTDAEWKRGYQMLRF